MLAQAKVGDEMVGVVVGKQEAVNGRMQGYIAMVAVEKLHRKQGIGKTTANLEFLGKNCKLDMQDQNSCPLAFSLWANATRSFLRQRSLTQGHWGCMKSLDSPVPGACRSTTFRAKMLSG